MRENVLFSKFVLFLFFGGKKCVTYCVYMFWNNNSIKNFSMFLVIRVSGCYFILFLFNIVLFNIEKNGKNWGIPLPSSLIE